MIRDAQLARRLWSRLEPIHAVTYFSPEARSLRLPKLGTRGSGWVTSRAAPCRWVRSGLRSCSPPSTTSRCRTSDAQYPTRGRSHHLPPRWRRAKRAQSQHCRGCSPTVNSQWRQQRCWPVPRQSPRRWKAAPYLRRHVRGHVVARCPRWNPSNRSRRLAGRLSGGAELRSAVTAGNWGVQHAGWIVRRCRAGDRGGRG